MEKFFIFLKALSSLQKKRFLDFIVIFCPGNRLPDRVDLSFTNKQDRKRESVAA